MKRVLIPYSEGYPKSILIALNSFKEYADMKMEDIGKLMNDFFHEKKDIYFDVSSERLPQLLDCLKSDGFVYRLSEIE